MESADSSSASTCSDAELEHTLSHSVLSLVQSPTEQLTGLDSPRVCDCVSVCVYVCVCVQAYACMRVCVCSNGRNRAAATYLVEVDGIAVRDYYSVTHHTNCASSGP